MVNKSSAEYILMKIAELDALEFLGICKIVGVDVCETETNVEDVVEGGPANVSVKADPRPFEDIWSDVCEKVAGMNRARRRTLSKLVCAATKKEK